MRSVGKGAHAKIELTATLTRNRLCYLLRIGCVVVAIRRFVYFSCTGDTGVSAGQGTVEQDGIGKTICRSRFPYVYKYEAGPHRK